MSNRNKRRSLAHARALSHVSKVSTLKASASTHDLSYDPFRASDYDPFSVSSGSSYEPFSLSPPQDELYEPPVRPFAVSYTAVSNGDTPPRNPAYNSAARPVSYDHSTRPRPKQSGQFCKESRGGGVSLRLVSHPEDASIPVYYSGDIIEGTAETPRKDRITSVAATVRSFF